MENREQGTEKKWLLAARKVCWKVNTAWVLEHLALPLVLLSLGLTLGVLLMRHFFSDLPINWLIWGCVISFALLFVWISLWSRKKFESCNHALMRLESHLKLNSRLSSAYAGQAVWPALPEENKTLYAGLDWNYKRLLLPFIGSLLLIVSAFSIPVKPHEPTLPEGTPRAWQRLHADIDDLEAEELIEPEYLKHLEKKLNNLQNQAEEDWFSHSSLEATEHLEQSHREAAETLENQMEQAANALQTLEKFSDQLNGNEQKQLQEQFNSALEEMQKGQMRPNKELLEQLKKIDPAMLNNLSPEQLQQLRKNMQKLQKKLQQQAGQKNKKPGQGENQEGNKPANKPGGG